MVYRNFTSSPAAGFSIDLQFDHDVLEVCVCAPRLFINNIIINPRFGDTEGSAKQSSFDWSLQNRI